jgi:hypothetical protein
MSKIMRAGLASLFLGAFACGVGLAQDETAALKAEADGLAKPAADLAKQYGARLMSTLQGAIEKNGPLGAVEVCRDAAPKIAAELSSRSGWSIARTSLKLRNSASAPDAYERATIEVFATRIAQGEDAAKLASAEIVFSKDGKTSGFVKSFRFIKAIPTGELCLTCHGADVDPELKRKIDALYPNDRATGFKLGDLRGVFTLTKRLN